MIMKFAVWLGVFWAALAPAIGRGGQIGEPAAPLTVKEWIKGKPVEVKNGTNIVVVEIFASSSLASRASITNLNAVQKHFKAQGVVVVGVSDEPAERLKTFVQTQGTNIEYAIAADNQRQTSLNYMMPVKQRGVPCVFVVGKDGRLLWYGHPLHGMNQALEQIVKGRYNVELAAKADIARMQMGQYLGFARQGDPRARMAGVRLLATRTNDVAQLCDVAFQIATDPGIVKRDVALASAALDQAEKLAPTNSTRVGVTRAVLVFESGKKEEGLARARQAIASAVDQKEKANAEGCLRTMEARVEAAKTNQIQKARIEVTKTNQTSTNPIPTNQPTANRTQGPAGKP
jgi:peroxiredoxin